MVYKPFNFESKGFKATMDSYNVLLHILTGMVIAIPMLYGFVNSSSHTLYLHIMLSIPGFQLLMAESFLGLCPYNTWSANLNTKNRRRAHWVLALMGSALAIAGCLVMMVAKPVNFTSTHGILGVVALVFTMLNLITGVAALYAQPLSKIYIPVSFSKISHILGGVVAFVTAGASLCYAYDKNSFRNWSSNEVAVGCIVLTGAFTIILCINPMYTCYKRCMTALK